MHKGHLTLCLLSWKNIVSPFSTTFSNGFRWGELCQMAGKKTGGGEGGGGGVLGNVDRLTGGK